MKLVVAQCCYLKSPYTEFHENPTSGIVAVTVAWTDKRVEVVVI